MYTRESENAINNAFKKKYRVATRFFPKLNILITIKLKESLSCLFYWNDWIPLIFLRRIIKIKQFNIIYFNISRFPARHRAQQHIAMCAMHQVQEAHAQLVPLYMARKRVWSTAAQLTSVTQAHLPTPLLSVTITIKAQLCKDQVVLRALAWLTWFFLIFFKKI